VVRTLFEFFYLIESHLHNHICIMHQTWDDTTKKARQLRPACLQGREA
jgi:hypothetical protein